MLAQPNQYVFAISAPALPARCPKAGHRLAVLTGQDEPARQFLGTWRYWCPICQELTLTDTEAAAALAALEPGALGAIVAISLPLAITGDALPMLP